MVLIPQCCVHLVGRAEPVNEAGILNLHRFVQLVNAVFTCLDDFIDCPCFQFFIVFHSVYSFGLGFRLSSSGIEPESARQAVRPVSSIRPDARLLSVSSLSGSAEWPACDLLAGHPMPCGRVEPEPQRWGLAAPFAGVGVCCLLLFFVAGRSFLDDCVTLVAFWPSHQCP